MVQATREGNPYLGKTYTYDNAGNRLSKTTYAYTTEENPGTATSTQTYTYNSDSTWGNQLSGYTYDEIGNPSYYNGYALTWSGRQLMEMSMNGGQITYSFTYNADGIRTSKNINGTVHIYTLNGTQVVSETWVTTSSFTCTMNQAQRWGCSIETVGRKYVTSVKAL